MNSKSTTQTFNPQELPAGINQNNCIEFFGDRKTKTVKYLKNGHVYSFNEISPKDFTILSNAYQENSAKNILSRLRIKYVRQVELFTYYMWGLLDNTPDIINGKLQPSENFRHKAKCISLQFTGKQITINGVGLNERDLQIIDLIAADLPDKAIADQLNIAIPTLSFHKKNLLTKTGTFSKTGLLYVSMKENVVN